jgi:hypothetical protein
MQFTHTFEFEIGVVGDGLIKGECEFNVDGKLSYKIEQSSTPLAQESLKYFNEVMDLLFKIFTTTKGIKIIKVKQK